MNSKDPLIDEPRRAGQAYIDSFKGDWAALVADLNLRSERKGRKVVSMPPKPPRRRSVTKRAG
jgi:hypothetical protein